MDDNNTVKKKERRIKSTHTDFTNMHTYQAVQKIQLQQ